MSLHPAERARRVQSAFPVLRPRRDAVAEHARALAGGHVMSLHPIELSHEAPPTDGVPLADSPAELSRRLLAALFGRWPAPSDPAPPTRRRPGLTVRELTWDEAQRLGSGL